MRIKDSIWLFTPEIALLLFSKYALLEPKVTNPRYQNNLKTCSDNFS